MIIAVNFPLQAIGKKKPEKNQGFNGIRTRDLHATGALPYQLSYEATHWERVICHLSVANIVKTSVSQQSSEDFEVDEDTRQYMEQDKATISYQAAQIIKNDIKQCKGISIKPLCVEDLSIEKGECTIPERSLQFSFRGYLGKTKSVDRIYS